MIDDKNKNETYQIVRQLSCHEFSFILFDKCRGKPLIEICDSKRISTDDVNNGMSLQNFNELEYITEAHRLFVMATAQHIPFLDDVTRSNVAKQSLGNQELLSFFEKHTCTIIEIDNELFFLVGSYEMLNQEYAHSQYFPLQIFLEEQELKDITRIAGNPDQIKELNDKFKNNSSIETRSIVVSAKPCDTYKIIADAISKTVSTIQFSFDEQSNLKSVKYLHHEQSVLIEEFNSSNDMRAYATLLSLSSTIETKGAEYITIKTNNVLDLPEQLGCHCSKMKDAHGNIIFIVKLFLVVTDTTIEKVFAHPLKTSNQNLRKRVLEKLNSYQSVIICAMPNHCLTHIEHEIHNAAITHVNNKHAHGVINTDNYYYQGSKLTPISAKNNTNDEIALLSPTFINMGKTTDIERLNQLVTNHQRVIAITLAAPEQVPRNLSTYIIKVE